MKLSNYGSEIGSNMNYGWLDFTDATSVTFYTTPVTTGSDMQLTLKTVRLKAGFVGQVLHNDNIIWESTPKKTLAKADKAAQKARDKAVARLFEDN